MSVQIYSTWTEEEVSTAKRMWFEGKSASEISRVIKGRSRNAVIGLADRKGWERSKPQLPKGLSEVGRKPRAKAWTPEETEKARALYIEGQSYAQISSVMEGRTEEAVRTQMNRCGLNKSTVPAQTRHSRPNVQPSSRADNKAMQDLPEEERREAYKARADKALESFAEPANDNSVSLLERGRFQCAWPVGSETGAAMMCCGARVDGTATLTTQSYCKRHRDIASAGTKPPLKTSANSQPQMAVRRSRTVWDSGRAA